MEELLHKAVAARKTGWEDKSTAEIARIYVLAD
jgi:hypothetical protein